jgi:hypothetical protein
LQKNEADLCHGTHADWHRHGETMDSLAKDRHACDVGVLFLGRAVVGAYPKGEGREGWKVAPNGCEIGPFLHASEILTCGGSDCNGIEDLSNFGSRIWVMPID